MKTPALLALLTVLAVLSFAGEVLENDGRPMVVDFRCTNEDVQWAGLTCSEADPCVIYLEVTAVEAVGVRVFAAGNIHSATSTLYSVLLTSDDGGKTWREPFERLRGAGFDHIQFVDFENGWISGQTLQPLPRDPFLLITSDGGKTWRQRPLFGEGHAGSIAQFWFTSRTNGSLIVDNGPGGGRERYELYETSNGGETWAARETSRKPIQLKRPAGDSAGWRVRADAATRAFLIERREGGRWDTLAGFSVALNPCTPPEAVPEPAPQ